MLLLLPVLCSMLQIVGEVKPALDCLTALPPDIYAEAGVFFQSEFGWISGQFQFDFYCSLRKARLNWVGSDLRGDHCVCV